MSTFSKTQPRVPIKSTPFSNIADSSGKRTTSRSYLTRYSMTESIRKAKKGRTLALKRHMQFAPSTTDKSIEDSMHRENPYQIDARVIQETIEVVESIVKISYPKSALQWNGSLSTLASLIERLCVLISPETSNERVSPNLGFSSGEIWNQRRSIVGASYDSSIASIAANSILFQFVNSSSPESQLQSSQQQNAEENLGYALVNALASILTTTIDVKLPSMPTSDNVLQCIQSQTAIVLTQLSATEPPPPPLASFDQDQFSPYGHPSKACLLRLASAPTSWCHVLVNSPALSALVEKVSISSSPKEVDVYEKCVWAVGNLAGDSEFARKNLQEMSILPRLISCVSLGLKYFTDECQNLHSELYQPLVNLVRNSLWALTNLIRAEGSSASELLAPDGIHTQSYRGQLLQRLTLQDFEILLTTRAVRNSNDIFSNDNTQASWYDILIETCWLMTYLTSRDSSAVEFFCSKDERLGYSVVISALHSRLFEVTEAVTFQCESDHSFVNTQQNLTKATPFLISSCRVLRNIAVSSGGSFVSLILADDTTFSSHNSTDDNAKKFSMLTCLSKLILLGTLGAGNDAALIAIEAASAVGACLIDAGFPLPHASTSACHVFIPALCDTLTSQRATFDVKREAIWALWNAVNIPPNEHLGDMMDKSDVYSVQKQLLAEVIRTYPEKIVDSLTKLLSTMDFETMEASILLIHALLQNFVMTPSGLRLSVLFEEAGLIDALWRICDHDSEESEVAELAAFIIDEYFDEEVEETEEEINYPIPLAQDFEFNSSSFAHIPQGGFNFANDTALPSQREQMSPIGRGRGRGQVTPSWMQRP